MPSISRIANRASADAVASMVAIGVGDATGTDRPAERAAARTSATRFNGSRLSARTTNGSVPSVGYAPCVYATYIAGPGGSSSLNRFMSGTTPTTVSHGAGDAADP